MAASNPESSLAPRREADLEYLKKINIVSIFKELLAKLLEEKQQSVEEIKKFLVYELKLISFSNKVEFFDEGDFDVIFQAFDVFNEGELRHEKVFNILSVFKIPFDKDNILAKYKLSPKEPVKKAVVLKIVKREYNKMVSLDNTS